MLSIRREDRQQYGYLLQQQNQNYLMNDIPQDIFNVIAEPLRKRDLESLGSTCKNFYKFANDSLMWRNLFLKMRALGSTKSKKPSYKKAFESALKQKTKAAMMAKICFECDNHYTKMDVPKAIEMVDFIFTRSRVKPKILVKALLAKAELIAELTPVTEENHTTISDLVNEILLNPLATAEEKAKGQYIKRKVEYLNPELTENEISDLFIKACLDPNLPDLSKIEAEIYLCIMSFNTNDENNDSLEEIDISLDENDSSSEENDSSLVNKNLTLSKVEALERLKKILGNRNASIDQHALAALNIAKEYMKLKTMEKDQSAENLLDQVVHDLDASDIIRMTAAFHLAEMCYENRTNIIDNDKAFEYLQQIACCKELDEEILGMTDLYQALFLYEKRKTLTSDETNLTNDNKAFQLFKKINDNGYVGEHILYEAILYQAIMRYERRTEEITDIEAMALLNEIVAEEDPLPPRIDSKAALYIALMNYRSGEDDKKAYQLFDSVSTDELAEEKDRNTAKEYLQLMQDSGRASLLYL